MKGKIRFKKKTFSFSNIHELRIEFEDRVWCYDGEKSNATRLSFKIDELGYAGMGNWLKQWRKRGRLVSGNEQRQKYRSLTQKEAAKILKVTQPFVSQVEREQKSMPVGMFWRIRRDIVKYGRNPRDPFDAGPEILAPKA